MNRLLPTLLFLLLFLCGCEVNNIIVNDVEEREANEIIVFLASHRIAAEKTPSPTAAAGAAATTVLWSIAVPEEQMTEAMSILNQNGLPRKKSVTLLDLFAKQGLMTTEKEESIRYQAGLAEQIAGTIRKIDGVIDADVQLSFPPEETGIPGATAAVAKKVTASVYVKHQGILDDPNSHLITKIKRLVSGSVNGLDLNDVTVISDRARFAEVTVATPTEMVSGKPREYVSIWSIVMSKASAGRFRFLFFILSICTLLFAIGLGWLIWKVYPLVKGKKGLRSLFSPKPLQGPPPEEPPPQ